MKRPTEKIPAVIVHSLSSRRSFTKKPLSRLSLMAILSIAAFATFFTIESATAASLRCDKGILPVGSHMYEVTELCGDPVAEFSRVEYLHPQVPVYVDEWIYRLGTSRFQRMLRFENGRLRSIRTLRKPRPEPYTGAGAQPAAAEYRISY